MTKKKATRNAGAEAETTALPTVETAELRSSLRAFLHQKVEHPLTRNPIRLGSYKFGAYAFFDYDGEPIYVGRTYESLSSRIGRHLTGQRSDAVAKNVLDPFEVYEVEVWPLPQYQGRKTSDTEARAHVDALEAAVFKRLLKESQFKAVLNEAIPTAKACRELPRSFRGVIVSEAVRTWRGHPDVRLARRAATIGRLAQVISERQVSAGLRRTLLTQAQRLELLARRRFARFSKTAERVDEKSESGDDA